MMSSVEKESLEKGITRDKAVPWLQELFQDQRYEAIVEAIELHKGDRGERRPFLQESVLKSISNMINAMGNEPLGFKQGLWEEFFKKNNEEKTWRDFIRESLQSGSTGGFSRGIQAIKQSIIDFNKTR